MRDADDSRFGGPFLGVLGGMGPMAGAVFMERLTALTPGSVDQAHVPAILWSDPRIPDRPAGRAGMGPDPLPWMRNGMRHLERAGARAIVIPCNTAHVWYDALAAAVSVPVLHIVSAVVDDLRRQGVARGRIGLLGTATTLRLALYQRELTRLGYTCVVPDEDELARHCAESIRLVKMNHLIDARGPATEAVVSLLRRRVDAVVLGCTELPLALPHAVRGEFGTVMTDSIDALALAAIAWHAAAVGS
ncbi:MAG: aspartate/glutamate racemase family protein [Candidimonas sp.]|nr:MAG: aspartate/glutamate racemase family protein [Candidimonas sp.]